MAYPGALLVVCLCYSGWRNHDIAPGPAMEGAVAAMSGTLERYVPAGVPVQPLDWTSGAVHAMLRTQHPLGTRFLYDYHFYHHVQTPFIQSLRAEFVTELVSCRVPYVLEVRRAYKAVVSGINTSDRFPALERALSERYDPVYETKMYRLLRLKFPAAASPPVAGVAGFTCGASQ